MLRHLLKSGYIKAFVVLGVACTLPFMSSILSFLSRTLRKSPTVLSAGEKISSMSTDEVIMATQSATFAMS